MLNYCKKNDVDFVCISELSRLGRSNEVLNTIETLTALNIGLISLKDNITTLNPDKTPNPNATLLSSILSGINQFELTTIKYRIKSGLNHSANQGNVGSPNSIPFGYMKALDSKKMVVHPEESQVVKQIFETFTQGKGCQAIQVILNGQNIPSKKGLRWNHSTIYDILTNSIYKGERRYKGQIINTPAIIDTQVFDKVQQDLRSKRNYQEINRKYPYILNKKLIICGCCQKFYVANHNEKNRLNSYQCNSKFSVNKCQNHSINVDKLELAVKYIYYTELSKLVKIPENLNINGQKQEKQAYQNEVKKLENKENNFLELFTDELITKENLQKKLVKIREDKTKLEQKIEKISAEIQNIEKTQNALNDVNIKLGLNTTNAHTLRYLGTAEYLRQVVKSIIIRPSEVIQANKQDRCIEARINGYNGSEYSVYLSQRSDYFLYQGEKIAYGFNKKMTASTEERQQVVGFLNKILKV
jgi:DNA invertase Pin-like site-specific DNA recombinase